MIQFIFAIRGNPFARNMLRAVCETLLHAPHAGYGFAPTRVCVKHCLHMSYGERDRRNVLRSAKRWETMFWGIETGTQLSIRRPQVAAPTQRPQGDRLAFTPRVVGGGWRDGSTGGEACGAVLDGV